MTTPSNPEHKTLGDRYDVVAPIGRGAAAQVYRVRDRWNGSERAAKVLLPESVKNEHTLRRFEDEYRILRGLHHPSLPEVYDYGWVGEESRYMIMELVDGEPLDQYFQAHTEDLWIIIYELCEVLSFTHDHNLLHQDIKPSNILVRRTTAFGEEMPLVTLLDFGLTFRRDGEQRGGMVGTPTYMAPEVIRGETPLTRAVDYYSLGVTLFELLTGDVPFKGSTREVLGAHLEDIPRAEREKIEYAELYPLVYGLMSKDKNERMEVFGKLRGAITGRLMDVPEELERSYALAIIRSLGLIGKVDAWEQLTDWIRHADSERRSIVVWGPPSAGKSYLVERLVAHRQIRGARTLTLGQGSEFFEFVRSRSHEKEAAQSALWHYLKASEERALLVLDGELQRDEEVFAEYVDDRVAMSVSDAGLHVLRTSRFPPEEVSAFVVGQVGDEAKTQVLNQLTPRLHDTSGGELRLLLEHSAHSGDIVRRLTATLARGELTVQQGKWRFVHAPSLEISDEDDGHGADLYGLLPDSLRDIAITLATHPIPLPRLALRDLAMVSDANIDRFIELVRHWGVVTASGTDDTEELGLRPSFKAAVVSEVDRTTRRAIDQAAIAYWSQVHPSELSLTCLAAHYEANGESREALNAWIRLLRLAEKGAADNLVTSSVVHILENAKALGASPAVEQYGLKKVLRLERRRSRVSEIARYIKNYNDRHGHYPPVLLKDYAFELHSAFGAEKVRALVENALASTRWPAGDYLAQLMMQLILAENNLNNRGRALELQADIMKLVPSCSSIVQNEIMVRELIVLDGSGLPVPEVKLDKVEADALRLDNIDGYLVAVLIRINSLFGRSQLNTAMQLIARSVRVAHRHGRTRRVLQLYFQASAIYFGMGAYDRSIRALKRANRAASDLGDRKAITVNLLRLAMNYQCLGLFGNAARFAEKALLVDGGRTETSVRARVALADIYVMAHQRGAEAKLGDAKEWLKRGDRVDDVYLGMISAYFEMNRGSLKEAIAIAGHTMELANSVQLPDDAARAALIKAWALLESGTENDLAVTLEFLRTAVPELESPMIRGELAAIELASASNDDQRVDDLLTQCVEARARVNDAIVGMRMDRAIIKAAVANGDRRRASVALDRYYKLTREIVANMMGVLDPNAFLVGEKVNEFMSQYASWKRAAQ